MPSTNADDPLRTNAPDPSTSPMGEGVTTNRVPGSPADNANTVTYSPRDIAQPRGTGPDFATGSVSVPGYEILGLLGRGGMGVVYKARHLALKRIVALKMVLSGGHASPAELVRFRREAEAVARLQHPNIVQIHEVGEAGGHPYCALEFVEGGNLAGRLKGKPLPAPEAVRLVEMLARAVQLAHSRNVVHRDLKPSNVLLATDGTPKIADFGLARQLDSDSCETQSGAMVGTPAYMAPEQAAGRSHDAGPAADVYALGVILYECLAGRPPFLGKTSIETLDQVRTQEPSPPSRLQTGVPPDLETICLKCLRKEPEKRYASAAELADDLARYQRGEPILARPVGRLERAGKWVKRNPLLALAAVVVVLALAGGATVSYLKYLDAEEQKGIAQQKEMEAQQKEQQARQEADKAQKARDFLVSIFRISDTDTLGGNTTARQILEDAEKRIPVEFADQPELRADLEKAVGDVKRDMGRRTPQAMILVVRGAVQLHSAAGVEKAAGPQTLLNLDDRLTLAADAQVQLVFVADFHKERLRPGREATIDYKGCQPADAVLERDDSILMTFVRLPKGTFYMGWDGKNPGVKTEIKYDFEIAVHDVTQGQWQAVMGNNPSWFSHDSGGAALLKDLSDEEVRLFPVEDVSWEDVQDFLKKLNEKTRGSGYVYRLPTEAEWEYACRGGATSEEECSYYFYFDTPTNDLSSAQANFNGRFPSGRAPTGKNRQRTTRVGAYPPNKLGLCDMHGNVWQWCADAFDQDILRGSRGGSWDRVGAVCQAAYPYRPPRNTRSSSVGFRLVRHPVRPVIAPDNPRRLACRGDWKAAAAEYAKVFAAQPLDDGELAFEYAAVLLLAEDQAGYRKLCAELLERSGQRGVRPYHAARACTLAPDSVKDAALPARKADLELRLSGNEFWSLTEQGALAYCAGRYDEAANLFDRSLIADSRPARAVLNWLWLSLVEHRRGKPAEARTWLEKATKWFEQYPDGIPMKPDDSRGLHLHNWLEAQILRREAEALLGSKK